jgi:hypothetical protein
MVDKWSAEIAPIGGSSARPAQGNSQRVTLAALPWPAAERERTRESPHGTHARCIVGHMKSPNRGFLPHLRIQAQNRGKCATLWVQVSDTLNPHNFRFPGMPDCHPCPACGCGGCSLLRLPLSCLLPLCLWAGIFSAASAGGEGDGGVVSGPDGAGVRVVGEHGARDAQLVD